MLYTQNELKYIVKVLYDTDGIIVENIYNVKNCNFVSDDFIDEGSMRYFRTIDDAKEIMRFELGGDIILSTNDKNIIYVLYRK